jgi:Xaa-Pro aminopeptidase
MWALELGADGLAFDPIVAFGTHTSSPHHHPTSRALQKGHLVQIDVGAKVKGYCGDMSEVYFTAKPTALQKKVYDTLTEAKNKAMRSVKAGVTTHALDRIARDVLKRDGFDAYFTHALGHGVGLDIHEGVTLSQKAPAQTLLAGEVITIEPGVYFDGKWGMRVEDMIVVQG